MTPSLQQKLDIIDRYLDSDCSQQSALNYAEKLTQGTLEVLARYNRASWTILDETTNPNSSIEAPEGVWGTITTETPKVAATGTYDYSMVLNLHRQGCRDIEIPLLEGEKQDALSRISSAAKKVARS
jgi:hypothetical protein